MHISVNIGKLLDKIESKIFVFSKVKRSFFFFWIIDKSRRDATEEVDILRRYSHHPNIIKLYAVYEDSANVYLIEEMCRGGELLNRIMTLKHFSEREAAAVMLRLANAISYLHSNQVCFCMNYSKVSFLFATILI